MERIVEGMSIAFLVTDGFEQVELIQPRKALDDAGAHTVLISPNKTYVQGWNHDQKGDLIKVDVTLSDAKASNYAALVLPGGVSNPDKLRINEQAISFVQEFVKAGKPIAAICHGPWTLINASAVKGKTMTSWPSLALDLQNAGAQWVNKEVVVDGLLVTSRKPDDIPAFNRAFIEILATRGKV